MHLATSSNSNKTNNKDWVFLIGNQIALVHILKVSMFVFVIFVMVLLGLVLVAKSKKFHFQPFEKIFSLTCDDGHDGGCVWKKI